MIANESAAVVAAAAAVGRLCFSLHATLLYAVYTLRSTRSELHSDLPFSLYGLDHRMLDVVNKDGR